MQKLTLLPLLVCSLLLLPGCPDEPTESTDEIDSSTSESTGDGDTTTDDTTTDTTDGPMPFCGDGNVDEGEECDDGNMEDTDECTAACTIAVCGDSIVQVGVEACDDGNMADDDGCSAMCLIESCGDGVVQAMEECDDANMVDTDDCTNMCLTAVCGDMIVQESVEECDDGNAIDTDDCTAMCTIAVCGDGSVQEGVEQCDDANMADDDACVGMCLNAVCGDSLINVGVEECDDGNVDDNDACVNGCLDAACGDGFLNVGVEECDDGGMQSLDGCSASCMFEARIAFVTSSLYTGNMGGLQGADDQCNQRAQAAQLPGTYMAWLSTDMDTPATRFLQSAVPYYTVTGVKIADNWADLIDASLDAPLSITELGTPSPDGTNTCQATTRQVFTGTFSNGLIGNSTCSNWTSEAGMANTGQTTANTFRWSNCTSLGLCANASAIYCFQQ